MAKKDKKEKKAKAEKTEKSEKKRSSLKCMKGTIIPVAFEDFVEKLEELGEANHKGTVTTFSNDEVGVFMTIPKQGSTAEKVSLFLNKSRGWESEEEYSALEIDAWHTGDVRAIVADNPKAFKQGYKLCKEWLKDKPEHTPKPSKKVKAKDEDEEPKAKKSKKDKKEKEAKSNNGDSDEDTKVTRKKRKKKRAEAEAEA